MSNHFTCTSCGSCSTSNKFSSCGPSCGDSYVCGAACIGSASTYMTPEQCDDGNNASNDGCSNTC